MNYFSKHIPNCKKTTKRKTTGWLITYITEYQTKGLLKFF